MSTRHIDRKAVVKLAQEAGLSVQEGNSFADDIYISVLYRFANLVASQDSPDRFCVTTPDGGCASTDPRCMHQPNPAEQVDWSRSDTKASIVNIWQAITHQIMPVKLTEKMIEAALPQLMREDDEDKHRALGQLICVWDALIDAAKEEQRNDN